MVEGLKFDFRWWMLRTKSAGRRRSESQTGRGMRITSTKQVVGMGEERVECGPFMSGQLALLNCEGERKGELTKPSGRFMHNMISAVFEARDSVYPNSARRSLAGRYTAGRNAKS
jgi:hypothetical protein